MRLSLYLAQPFSKPFDWLENEKKIRTLYAHFQKTNGLIILPPFFLTGVTMGEFLFCSTFHKDIQACLERLAQGTKNKPALLLGAPYKHEGKIYNALFLLAEGKIYEKRFQSLLSYEQRRYFTPVPQESSLSTLTPIIYNNTKWAVPLMEEIDHLSEDASLDFICHMEARPLPYIPSRDNDYNKFKTTPIICVSLLSSDGIFTYPGGSFTAHTNKEASNISPCLFQETAYALDEKYRVSSSVETQDNMRAKIGLLYEALVFALRSFMQINGFSSIVLGLSGGIDSALVATLAVDALGQENVSCHMLTSPFTSQLSLDIARACAKKLGVHYKETDLNTAFISLQNTIGVMIDEKLKQIVMENVQARLRGLLLMAFSNQKDTLLLATGNKSEIATGYATLYGDMCGAYAPLKDIYKTQIYELARWRQSHKPSYTADKHPTLEMFPEEVLTRPSTAELTFNQKDQDTLPAYEILDDILYKILEEKWSLEQLNKEIPRENLKKALSRLKISAHKRQQGAPGARMSTSCFGIDIIDPVRLYADS